MKKYNAIRYTVILIIFTIGLTVSCLVPSLAIMNRIVGYLPLSKYEIFLNIMGSHTNYLSYNRIMACYVIAFILLLSFLYIHDAPWFIIRLKSRTSYIAIHIKKAFLLSFSFALLIEVIHCIFSFIVFGDEITVSSGLVVYSALDFITEFLFYFRVGVLLLIVGMIINKKVAPFLTIGIYLFLHVPMEYLSIDIWLPYKDCVVIPALLMKEMQPVATIPVIARALIIDAMLVVLSLYIFKNKDMITHEKK